MGKSGSVSEVSPLTLVALAARATAASLSVAVPLKFGVPSEWRLDALVTTDVLAVTRVASVAHVLVVIAMNVLGAEKSKWQTPRPGAVAATWRAIAGIASGSVVWFFITVSLGTSTLGKLNETAHLVLFLASLTFTPGAVVYGVPIDEKIGKTWTVLLTCALSVVSYDSTEDGDAQTKNSKTKNPYPSSIRHFSGFDLAWVISVWGTGIGAWLGAMPIPLDWDRTWQKWPVSVVAGAAGGFVIGNWIGFAAVAARLLFGVGVGQNSKNKTR